MSELFDSHERHQLEEQKLRLTSLIAGLVNNGQIIAIDLDGGKFLDEDRRRKLEATIQLIRRETSPAVNLLRDLQVEALSKITAPIRRIRWGIKRRSIPDLKKRLAAAIQFDMESPVRIRYSEALPDLTVGASTLSVIRSAKPRTECPL